MRSRRSGRYDADPGRDVLGRAGVVGVQIDMFDLGVCGCMVDSPEETEKEEA